MDIFDGWELEPLHNQAVRRLVEKYRDEYDTLVEHYRGERVEELERRVHELNVELLTIRGQNPNGTNVSALEMTANALAKENDELAEVNQRLTKQLASTKKRLDAIQSAVAEKVQA